MHRNGQDLLGPLLPDDIFIECPLDLGRLRQTGQLGFLDVLPFLGDDLIAEINTLVADENRGAGDKLLYFFLALAAERAFEGARMFFFFPP